MKFSIKLIQIRTVNMVRNCCVKGCKSFWYPNANLSLFRFPFKREEVLAQWLDVVPSKGKISLTSVICNKHFKQSDFQHEGSRRTLKDFSVPSIFLNGRSTSPGSSEEAHNTADSSDQNTTKPIGPNEVLTHSTNRTCPRKPTVLSTTVIPSNYITIPRETVESMRRQIIMLQKKNQLLERKYLDVNELLIQLTKEY